MWTKRAAWAACVFAVLTTAAMAQNDAVKDAVEAFEKQVGVAKKQFDTAVTRSVDMTVKRLVTLGETAARNKNEEMAGRAFKEVLRIDRVNAAARAYFQQRNKLDQVLTELTAEWRPLAVVEPEAREQHIFYECMLGRYKTERNWTPAVTLVMPDGTNVFNEVIRQRVASGSGDTGKLDMYSGTGTLIVPADGAYLFTGPARAVKLNGAELAEIREKPVELPLKKGVYAIQIDADQRYTEHVALTIVDARSGQRLVIFNSLAQIKKFLNEAHEANGLRRFDVSRWAVEQAVPLRMVVPQQK
jgi:hypothetical protein